MLPLTTNGAGHHWLKQLSPSDLPGRGRWPQKKSRSKASPAELAFFILTALVDEPRHGYGIVGEVAELSEGRVRLKVGTLYGVLDRLVGDGLIELDREEAQQGRLRRYYRLTESGRRALAAEAERQAANVRVASERLRAWRPTLGGSLGGALGGGTA